MKKRKKEKKNMKKRIAGILLVFCFIISMLNSSGIGTDAAAKIRLNKTSAAMRVGQKVRLSLRNMPKSGTVTWTSSAKNIAAVSKQGVVTAKKRGTASIRARLAYKSGGKNRTQRFTCKVTVRNKSTASAPTTPSGSETPTTPSVPSTPATPSVPSTPATPSVPVTPAEPSSGKTLVVYFSAPVAERQGQTDGISSASRTTTTSNYKGNTQYIAELISSETGADLFEIEAEDAYPDTYDLMVRRAEQEQKDNARPAVKNQISNMAQYDTIYVGYPIWWSDMPQILYTFFDTYDLSGKEIIPFCTHGGSSLSGTEARIRNLEPDADVYKGLAIHRTNVTDSDSRVRTWIQAKEK